MTKTAGSTVTDILSRLRKRFQNSYKADESIVGRSFATTLYSTGQLNEHAKKVAADHSLLARKVPDQLLERLHDNERQLLEVRKVLTESLSNGKVISPAGEWLLDNFYLIEEQVILARKHLPKGYSEGLPHLSGKAAASIPRVYDIVQEIISHSDGRVDEKNLGSFTAAYQSITILTLGELWAIPIMLRLAVIENLRSVCSRIASDMIDHELADHWADRMISTVKNDPGTLILDIADMARSGLVMNGPFVAGFTRKLQGHGLALSLPLSWMEDQLAIKGLSSIDLVVQENQKQAADQVSVRNSIGTLRFIGANDWSEFVETLSSIEQVLRKDSTGTYPLMDFATRDRYRHVVEAIAKSSSLSETSVAEMALSLAANAYSTAPNDKQAHVGYYLVDKGLGKLEHAVGRRFTFGAYIARFARSMPFALYFLAILVLTTAIATTMGYIALKHTHLHSGMKGLIILLSFSGALQLAISLIHWITTIWITPELLPRMDFSKDIPAEYRTLVVIPTMLSGNAYIDEITEALEIRFLANKKEHIHYGLLTDFTDAASEQMPEDEELLFKAKENIAFLNRKYCADTNDFFFLFHRSRTWNARDKMWMGYERKRGKLSALNALLRGHEQKDLSVFCGNPAILSRVKYVITLDSDTQLPREAAWKFIGTMAHPLNQAVYNAELGRVTEGYGILQPRVASAMSTGTNSLYLKMQGDTSGIDPYTKVSSDVYQDLFHEGSFIGKGIYDVSIFEQALTGKLPENRILSHDLLEGCYTRSGLLSDVVVYEENPSQYAVDIRRQHRWIRGDWQIGAWMLPLVTLADGRIVRNRLSLLSRWKIMDNLRRSLLPISLLLLLLFGWTVLPYPWFWTFAVTIIITLPVIAGAGWQLVHKPSDINTRAHLSEVWVSLRGILLRFIFGISVLPYEVFQSADAIARTNWRMIFSKRKLLEWTPSATASRNISNNLASAYLTMCVAPLLALACMVMLILVQPESIWVAAPILVLWLAAPALAWRISLPESEAGAGLSTVQELFLHKAARRTWAFFEQFVTAGDHWLPPDNYQKEPTDVIAHRTSPTNIGLSLLANLTAYDFGYISFLSVVKRCHDTLQTMQQMERYKGHFYNWYDTQTLAPLLPQYVSTVDSGNLIGHLLTLKQGIISLPEDMVFTKRVWESLKVTVSVVRDYHIKETNTAVERMATLSDVLNSTPESLFEIRKQLTLANSIVDDWIATNEGFKPGGKEWLNRLSLQIKQIIEDLNRTVPWVSELPVPPVFDLLVSLDTIPQIVQLPGQIQLQLQQVALYESGSYNEAEMVWLHKVKGLLISGQKQIESSLQLLNKMELLCEQQSTVSYDFLFDKSTNLLRIGYNVTELRKDDSFYDLLASEVRLGIFAGIAQGQLPQASWFALSRLLTNPGGDPILLSWSGSMFEYLMPQLVMPSYENTLLSQTSKATVKRQIEYATQRNVPWGISESAYNAVDTALNYQYRAFGVPGLGLKRGLEEDLVIAPYATMMALMIMPAKACENLQRMAKNGFEGEYGFYEAIDYTESRMSPGKKNAVIKSFMAHHQGMSFLSLSWLLLNKVMPERFAAEPRFQATLLLLQEKIPRATVFHAHTAPLVYTNGNASASQLRRIETANTPLPEIQLLSNGRYRVMVTNAGGGYSRWKELSLTRWREDSLADNYGMFCYIRETKTDAFWSNTYQPSLAVPDSYEAIFSQGYAEFLRNDKGIETKTGIVISPEDDVEMRSVRITNRTQETKVLEVTSYTEIVIATHDSDVAHPAFSNLFVQTEILHQHRALMCSRRPRSATETPPWMFHIMDVYGVTVESVSYETDRLQFIGRNRTVADPQAMHNEELSGSQGAVLDPVLSIRYRFIIKPNQTAVIDMVYGIAETRVQCKNLMHKYRDKHLKKRAFELSWTHSQVLLRQINASEYDARLYDQMAASMIFVNNALRVEENIIASNYRGQSGLWSHSVSGDLPILLLHVYDTDNIDVVKQVIQAHAYWKLKGLETDLVIWNEDHGSYRQLLQDQISGMTASDTGGHIAYGKPGGIFIRSADQLSPEDRILFASVARIILYTNRGSLSDQLTRIRTDKVLPASLMPQGLAIKSDNSDLTLPDDLLFFNGSGGFSQDGETYKILTSKQNRTPAPWVNVIANPVFGTIVSESGAAYTWAANAHEYRLTPWTNDPVSDGGGEAFYVRDEDSGAFWSPSPFPVCGLTSYIATHGFGHTTFEHEEQGIYTKERVHVDKDQPIKFIVLQIENRSGKDRKLSVTGFMEMVLGDIRSKTHMHVVSEYSKANQAILFRNRYNSTFSDQTTFFTVNDPAHNFTTDRNEFIGRNRNLQNPQSLSRVKLSGRTGAGKDTCAAMQVKFELPDGATKEIIFSLGSCINSEAANQLLRQFSTADAVHTSLEKVKQYWLKETGAIQIETPDSALNILANGWLIYQTISSRLFARSGFYQSGGAYGFRDQLQDVLSLLHTNPELARQQILLCASRQFAEGDVQHWWHPPEGRGVRTHCSDDLLWLPFAVDRYITATGNYDILKETAPFLEGRLLHPGEDSLYDLPHSGLQQFSLYEHCVRAIQKSLRYGRHGLPLIGSGDWNDGMDQVGNKGSGESVWLGFFLYKVLRRFELHAFTVGEVQFAETCRTEAVVLQSKIEASAWDGAWYLRAWFDNGTALGSAKNEECRIDSIAQSWAILSGAGSDERTRQAMASLDNMLVERKMKLIRVLQPAFDTGVLNPGYIKGYVPGVRENGGQYSHAAIWALMAFAMLNDREKVYELFSLIQPIGHSSDTVGRDVYKVEPYVMAADVYANESHSGRGGWTWYTGSSGWLYQFIIDFLIGLKRNGDKLTFQPCFPDAWESVKVKYPFGSSIYHLTIYQTAGLIQSYWQEGNNTGKGYTVNLIDDGEKHEVQIFIAKSY
jgi:cellobiose phosphorylase